MRCAAPGRCAVKQISGVLQDERVRTLPATPAWGFGQAFYRLDALNNIGWIYHGFGFTSHWAGIQFKLASDLGLLLADPKPYMPLCYVVVCYYDYCHYYLLLQLSLLLFFFLLLELQTKHDDDPRSLAPPQRRDSRLPGFFCSAEILPAEGFRGF